MSNLKNVMLLPVLCFVLLLSCKKDYTDKQEMQDFQALVSSDSVMSYDQNSIEAVFGLASLKYQEAAKIAENVKSGVTVYKITYNTTFKGEDLLASGLVCVPAKSGKFPALSFQNGTNVEYNKAPTKDIKNELFVMLESIASTGFVVVIPDYPGFGSSEQVFHPYLEKNNTLPALTDMLVAAKEFSEKKEIAAKLNGNLYIAGYSQGGWATMQFLKSLEDEQVPGYTLKAASCGAGPYDLNYLCDYITQQDTYPMPFYIAYLAYAYHRHNLFPNPLSDIFTDEYAQKIPSLFNGINSSGVINSELTTQISSLLQPTYITGHNSNPDFDKINQAFKNNSIAAWHLVTPAKLFHGENDDYVPIEVSERLVNDFRDLGVSEEKLQYIKIPDSDHIEGIFPFAAKTMNWFLTIKE